jgi:hypothetical protein
MGRIGKSILVCFGIVASGMIRMPIEAEMTQDLRERKLAPPPVKVTTWSRMGQSSLAGTFGGLRSAIAFFTSLSAHSHFQDQEWYELKKDYEVITSLAPYNPFYWSQGSHHLAFNAASWARTNRKFTETERLTIEREYLEAGDAFLRESLKYRPDDSYLWAEIARIWSHRLKRPDPVRALEAWENAARLSGNPNWERRVFFSLSQIRGREKEALDYALEVLKKYPQHIQAPTFRAALWALYQYPGLPPEMVRPSLIDVFGSKKRAYRDLYNYHFRLQDEPFYPGRIDDDLRQLIIDLKVPFDLNPFLNPRQRRMSSDW